MKKVTIIIPAYNEALYITELLEKVISVPTESAGYDKEIIFPYHVIIFRLRFAKWDK